MQHVYACFLWNEGYREYLPEHVNLWANALKHWDKDCRCICITEEKNGFNKNVEVVPLPAAAKRFKNIEAPNGAHFPSSYRRLWLFSDEAKALGERIMLLDIDCMILGDLSPLWDMTDDFVGWRPNVSWGREDRIGGGTWLLKTGKVSWLWDIFNRNPINTIRETREMGWNGSDQAILSRYLFNRYPHWPQHSGIYSAQDGVAHWQMPPKDAKIVHFNGKSKMWDSSMLWVRAYCDFFSDKHTRPIESQESGLQERSSSSAG